MADRKDDTGNRDQKAGDSGDETEELERKLSRAREDLPGDMEENRNLTGSTTWETLSTEAEEKEAQSRTGGSKGSSGGASGGSTGGSDQTPKGRERGGQS
ncbi:MAG: hypothetical protein WKG32_14165 [Gemmatimonadaceae bacterium]